MARFSIPTTARLSSTLRVASSNGAVLKSLGRLSRETLISLALDWLDARTVPNAIPYIEPEDYRNDEDSDSDDLYSPARSLQELQQLYTDLQQQKGSKRDIVSRIVEGDWRHGLTLYQLAMVDFAYLDDHPSSQTWTAYSIRPLQQLEPGSEEGARPKLDQESLKIPRFHPSTFLQRLQQQVLPDVKAHYQFHRPKGIPVLILRIFVVDSPYSSSLALSSLDSSGTATNFDASRSVYLAFPDGSPSLYISKSLGTGVIAQGESKSLHSIILNGVPQALSRPRERYTLKPSKMTSRNLDALLDKKGPGRENAAGGGWSIYADDKNKVSPVEVVLPSPPSSGGNLWSHSNLKRSLPASRSAQASKRARLVAKARFGSSGIVSDGKGIERLDVILRDPFPKTASRAELTHHDEEEAEPRDRSSSAGRRSTISAALQQLGEKEEEDSFKQRDGEWTPALKLTFRGTHVFGGIRQLVEAGIVDGERMPGWMTGDESVTIGVVRNGRIKGHRGNGL